MKDRLTPSSEKWPMRLAVMVEKAKEELKEAIDLADVDKKKEILEKLAGKGFPGLGTNTDSQSKWYS